MKAPLSIFYLDDDTDDLQFFREVTEALGHEVSIFVDGNAMLTALFKQKPDILFLDIHMPVFDGEEILHVIRKNEEWKDMPIVMISGILQKKLVRHYLDSGANYLMKKPSGSDWQTNLQQVLDIDWKTFQAFS